MSASPNKKKGGDTGNAEMINYFKNLGKANAPTDSQSIMQLMSQEFGKIKVD